ncbi:MAG: multiheme c-type cytochrome, partial [Planctomycetota bacterium]|nr:multiheme c-type cytochrome [Planctomycetota bacterium]
MNSRAPTSFRPIATAALAGLVFAALFSFPDDPILEVFVAEADDKDYQYLGTAQCSAPSCHGATSRKLERSSTEYTTWSKKDPHSKAFDKIVSDEAADIVEDYNEEASKPIKNSGSDPRCLRCHTVGTIEKSRRGSKFNLEDGVSCERCHGPASGFINIHNKDGSSYEKSKTFGMWDTRSIVKRADICISCHLTAD